MAPGDLEAGRRSLGERTNTMAAIRKLKKAVEAVIRAMGQVRGTDPRRRSGPARRRPGRSPVQRTCFSGRRTGGPGNIGGGGPAPRPDAAQTGSQGACLNLEKRFPRLLSRQGAL